MSATVDSASAGAGPPHTTMVDRRGKPFDVLDELPRLDDVTALAVVELPFHVYWSGTGRTWDLANRGTRVEAYRTLLREGLARDIAQFVDGDLLLDAWDDMVLPQDIRAGWQPVIDAARARRTD